MAQPFDSCPHCGHTYDVNVDEDGSLWSRRKETECACTKEMFCQNCDCDQCASCGIPLCDDCGGADLSGERFCSQHLPQPEITLTPLQVTLLQETAYVR